MTCRVAIQLMRKAAKVTSAAFWLPVYLRSLASCGRRGSAEIVREKGRKRTNSEEDVAQVHRYEDGVADPSPVEDVAGGHEDEGDDMMGEHLVVVFPSLLEVDDDDLLDPDCGRGRVS
jgi:hypothetical protein